MIYHDRVRAGRVLAALLKDYAGRPDAVVLALPRGGVPVGYEIACELELPLDVFVVRKLGVPGQEELAMGAIASGGARVLNTGIIGPLGISAAELDAVTREGMAELERREQAYRSGRPAPDVGGRTVILVDDGIATGSTIRAAVVALKQMGVGRLVVAVPVAPPSTIEELRRDVDEIVCPMTPEPFFAIGEFYDDFSQTSDATVRDLLAQARRPGSRTPTTRIGVAS